MTILECETCENCERIIMDASGECGYCAAFYELLKDLEAAVNKFRRETKDKVQQTIFYYDREHDNPSHVHIDIELEGEKW